ncbi:hypothetical protein ANCDUO_23230, partial [Ancylostoma duodenale]
MIHTCNGKVQDKQKQGHSCPAGHTPTSAGIFQPLPLSPPFPSECFSHTVLVAVPALFLCAVLPVMYLQIKTSRASSLPWTTLQSMKWLLATLMIGDKLVLLFFILWRTLFGSQPVAVVNIAYPIVQSVAMALQAFENCKGDTENRYLLSKILQPKLLVMILMNESRRAGLSNPGAIFCIWLTFVVCGAPEFYAWITIGSDPNLVGQVDFIQYVCYLAFYPLLVLQLLLNCFSDPSPFCNSKHFEYVKTHPETSASFVNRQVLWWFGPLVSKASKDLLEIDNLFDLDEDLEADNLTTLWEKEWNKSVR